MQMILRGHGPKRGWHKGAIDGAKMWWVAPDYPTIDEIIWPDLVRATEPVAKKNGIQKYAHRVELIGGGMITCKSASDPEKLVGVGLDGLVIDEAAKVPMEAWTKSLRATLSDKMGWATFISTPKGMNWFHDIFVQAQREGADWMSWQRPSSDNPLMNEEELAKAKEEIGETAYNQEYLAQFTDIEGAEFSGAYFHEGIWFDHWPDKSQIRMWVMGVDPSKGKTDKSDFTAIVWIALTKEGDMYVDADIDRRDVRKLVDAIINRANQVRPVGVAIETNQFQELLALNVGEQTKREGFGMPVFEYEHLLPKITRVRQLTPYLSRGDFKFYRKSRGARLLVSQLQEFPVGDYDDGPDALQMTVELTRMFFEGRVYHKEFTEEPVRF